MSIFTKGIHIMLSNNTIFIRHLLVCLAPLKSDFKLSLNKICQYIFMNPKPAENTLLKVFKIKAMISRR